MVGTGWEVAGLDSSDVNLPSLRPYTAAGNMEEKATRGCRLLDGSADMDEYEAGIHKGVGDEYAALLSPGDCSEEGMEGEWRCSLASLIVYNSRGRCDIAGALLLEEP